jgi:hypothetical protein
MATAVKNNRQSKFILGRFSLQRFRHARVFEQTAWFEPVTNSVRPSGAARDYPSGNIAAGAGAVFYRRRYPSGDRERWVEILRDTKSTKPRLSRSPAF